MVFRGDFRLQIKIHCHYFPNHQLDKIIQNQHQQASFIFWHLISLTYNFPHSLLLLRVRLLVLRGRRRLTSEFWYSQKRPPFTEVQWRLAPEMPIGEEFRTITPGHFILCMIKLLKRSLRLIFILHSLSK